MNSISRFCCSLLFIFSNMLIAQVGVGTTNPQATLEVESSSTTIPVFRLLDSGSHEFFRAQDNQHIGIGETNPQLPLHVKGSENNSVVEIENTRTGTTADVLTLRLGRNTPETSNQYIRFFSGSGQIGLISGDDMGGILYSTASDARLKENIKTTVYGVNDLLKINVVDYNFKTASSDKVETGMLAQELYEIWPQAVVKRSSGELNTNDDEDVWAVDYGRLTPLLIKAIQQQQKQIEELKTQLKTLTRSLEKNAPNQ